MSKTELLFRAVEALSTPAAKAVARGLTLWIGFNVLVVVFLVWRAWKKREVAQMSTVQIYGADMVFLNEIPFRCVQDAEQYADQLKKTDPALTYLVMDDPGQQVSMR